MVLQYAIWGDGVALCLPRDLAQKIHATAGAHVDLTIEGGKVILAPIEARTYTLARLRLRPTRRVSVGVISRHSRRSEAEPGRAFGTGAFGTRGAVDTVAPVAGS